MSRNVALTQRERYLMVLDATLNTINFYDNEMNLIRIVNLVYSPCGIAQYNNRILVSDFTNAELVYNDLMLNELRREPALDRPGGLIKYWDYLVLIQHNLDIINFYDIEYNLMRSMTTLTKVWDVTVRNNLMYFTDFLNNRILVYNLEGILIKVVNLGYGPIGVCIWGENIVVSDHSNTHIHEYDIEFNLLRTTNIGYSPHVLGILA